MLQCIPSQHCYLGKYEIFTEEDIQYYDRLEKEWLASHKRLSTAGLLTIFPEAANAFKKNSKQKISSLKAQLHNLLEIEKGHLNSISLDPTNKELYDFWIKDIDEERNKIKRQIRTLIFLTNPSPANSRGITDADIARAKEVPIENFYSGQLRSYGNRLTGKCELHTDNTASFFIYKEDNHWYCYGESAGGDSISYVRRLHNLGFVEAIKFILRK